MASTTPPTEKRNKYDSDGGSKVVRFHSVDNIAISFRPSVGNFSYEALCTSRQLSTSTLKDSSLLCRHLSKSASELSRRGDIHLETAGADASTPGPGAAQSASNVHNHVSVVQKTHYFFSTLKERWSRGRSRERRRRRDVGAAGGSGAVEESHSTDYAADNSSEHSSSVTPLTQSPRHRHLGSPPPDSPLLMGHRQSSDSAPPGDSPSSRPKVTTSSNPVADASNLEAALESAVRVCNGALLTDDSPAPSPTTTCEDDPLHEACVEKDDLTRQRESQLRQHSFFQLRVHLKRGKDLIARDKSGTSDPYVKFKAGSRLLYKSKTIYRDLNPVWDESFVLPIEDVFNPIQIKVFDYDWGLQDDFMGTAYLDLTKYEFGKPTDVILSLKDTGKSEYLGEVHLTCTLWPKSQEDKEQYFQRSGKMVEINRRLKSQIWSSVVTIVLVEGKNLLPMDIDGFSDPYVKFRLGNEKYKSKVCYKTLNPSWLEQFDLHLYDDQSQELELTVWDKDRSKDDFMGRCSIDLSQLEREKTHRIKQELDEGAGTIFLLLTISGTTASETISDLTTYDDNPRERTVLEDRYALMRTFHNIRDVGHLTVRVYRAQGLAAADLGGKSDPFCVLELINARLQTQTEYKTLSPSWQKIFTFNVKDIHSVLEVTVYDEDRDHKVEFLGKVAIPLLRIRNGEKRWYALKDKKLYGRAKGNAPQILLEMNVIWNPIRACIRTLNPKEEKYMQTEVKFKRQVFVRNVMRLKAIIMWFIDISKFIQSCFEWESTIQSVIALVLFILLCYYFQPFMIPVGMLLVFLKCYIVQSLTGGVGNFDEEDEPLGEDDDDDDDKDKEEKKSLKERLQAIQEVTQTVQNSIGYIASLGESIKNTFNFTVPFLSYLSVALLLVVAVVLYWVPVRYLIMGWGVNKFARKLIRPHTVPNNELLDLLSRVPTSDDLIAYRELKPHPSSDMERRRDQRKKHKVS
ncbi:multiple C2 and transmembrane domain-containing protein-like isoform X2 [Macrosteles quadrilineatus]|uniref:multiple C2 and transmembrane domain-containing protein-like isoform X2 n=1 Tax=Macrosteles quadrilineatus TaxID=74068 RepID=UPI0023E1352E|nr:multiple C2 and transmembrane domain-containing protein-like isoform X2 [Macrosteles quadrilineatus]